MLPIVRCCPIIIWGEASIELIIIINAYIVENSENDNDNSENEPVRNLSVHHGLLRKDSDPLDLPHPAQVWFGHSLEFV